MSNLPVNLGRKDKVIRSGGDPIRDGFLGRQAVPDAIQFDSVEASRVVSEKIRLFEPWRIETVRSLPRLVGVPGKSDISVRHPSLSVVLQSIVPNVEGDWQALRRRYPKYFWQEPRSHN